MAAPARAILIPPRRGVGLAGTVAAMNADDLIDPPIGGAGTKGWPQDQPPLRRHAIAARGWNLLRGDLPLPLAVIRRDALAANLQWMQGFARARGADMAPHGKTT
ncbi:MAG: hypothetical protein J0L57_17185, partial [Burkholderiales bacterium]|nr:hypothetical protein [Burkholderiales bacterium]